MSKKTWMILGAVAVGAVLLSHKGASAGPLEVAKPGEAAPKMASVGLNEKVSAQTFKLLPKRRGGYFYVGTTALKDGGIEFVSPVAGFFTRYVVKDAKGHLFAEVMKAA